MRSRSGITQPLASALKTEKGSIWWWWSCFYWRRRRRRWSLLVSYSLLLKDVLPSRFALMIGNTPRCLGMEVTLTSTESASDLKASKGKVMPGFGHLFDVAWGFDATEGEQVRRFIPSDEDVVDVLC
eukprot:m.252066 g.252066  ORF g.252066 m.252066 type:complete len:127 (-) comp15906_c0_seq2:1604-1984(-)